MPRPKSENTVSITLKLPKRAIELADQITEDLNDEDGLVCRTTHTDVLRYSLIDGMKRMKDKMNAATQAQEDCAKGTG
jgi:hypothetical protein